MASRDGRVFRRTRVRLGEPWDEGGPLALEAVDALGDLGRWGAPTGIAFVPDASGLVLGQRRDAGRERLVEIRLDCGAAGGE